MRTAMGLAAVAAMGIAMTGCPRGSGGGCLEECFAGTTRCNGDAVESCGDYDSDACMEFGAGVPCGTGTSCSFGGCSATCSDECVAGTVSCAGDAVQTCGDYDADACLDLGPAEPCPLGDACSNGACGPTCADECADGGLSCAGTDAQRLCGEWDSDACNDWSPPIVCPGATVCMGAGMCVTPTCTDECDPATHLVTCGSATFSQCVTDGDADACTEVVDTPCAECQGCPGPTTPPDCVECCCAF